MSTTFLLTFGLILVIFVVAAVFFTRTRPAKPYCWCGQATVPMSSHGTHDQDTGQRLSHYEWRQCPDFAFDRYGWSNGHYRSDQALVKG